MNISAKGNYAIASLLYIAKKRNTEISISLTTIAESLNISKIYLEQIFSALKKAKLVISIKGPKGGYQLQRDPEKITLFDILKTTESNLFNEKIKEHTIMEMITTNHILTKIDNAILDILKSITLQNLLENLLKYENNYPYMYYI